MQHFYVLASFARPNGCPALWDRIYLSFNHWREKGYRPLEIKLW